MNESGREKPVTTLLKAKKCILCGIKARYLAAVGVFSLVMAAMPPNHLTAQMNLNTNRVTENSATIEATAKFVPAAHVMVEHGVVTDIANLEPSAGGGAPQKQQDIYVRVIGGNENDTVVVSCDVENGDRSQKCSNIDIDGPQQVVQAGDTMRSNLTVQPAAARALQDKDMTVVISFSYI